MEKARKDSGNGEEVLSGKILFRYLPYWPLFVLLFGVGVALAFTYLHYATPQYEATAKILIKDEKKGAEDSKAFEDLNLLSSKKIIENEMEVISSNDLIGQVIDQLELYAPVYTKSGWKLQTAYISSPVRIRVVSRDWHLKAENIGFSVNKARTAVSMGGKSYPFGTPVQTPYGDLVFVSNDQFSAQTADDAPAPASGLFFFSLHNPKDVITDISKRLKVTSSNKLSSIIDLSVVDESPERAEDILNTLLKDYNNTLIQDKNMLATNTLNFIEARLSLVRHELDSIEHKVQNFRSEKGAINMDTQGKMFLEDVSLNDQKLSELNMQIAVLDQVENYVEAKDNTGNIVPSTLGVNDVTLSQLIDKLSTAELEYAGLKKTTAENNPLLLAITEKINNLKPEILDNIKSQRKSLEASRGNLTTTNNSYTSALSSMPEKERQLIDISRAQSIKNEIYTFLLQKKEAAALSFASTVSDSRIVDKAEASDKPVSPKRLIVCLIAVMAALITGIALVYVRETLNRKVMFRYEIESLTESPVIGEITSAPSMDPIVTGDDQRTYIAEQFRKLRVSLNFVGINSVRKRILVTSSISGEGKSFIAANLALTLALTGKKVALLDFDLNNPSLNNKLNINEHKGIADFLKGKAQPDEIIMPTDLHDNLFMVPTGELPSNPSELIMNGKTEDLLNHLDAIFDYLVIDTAPVSPVTDAYILAPYCDATLFVIRHGYTPKIFVQRIDENNRINHLNNMAIVFNAVTARGFGNKNYGYGYGYGYIYRNKEDVKRFEAKKSARRILN